MIGSATDALETRQPSQPTDKQAASALETGKPLPDGGVAGRATTHNPTAAPATTPAGPSETTDTATFSSRGERLAALNREFNITESDFKVTTGFIERLHELGFLSAGEAKNLAGRAASSDEDPKGTALSALQSDLMKMAEDQPADGDLAQLLNDTASALGALGKTSAAELGRLEQRLTLALENDPPLDKTGLFRMTQARDAMVVAGQLASDSGASSKAIASYLQHRG